MKSGFAAAIAIALLTMGSARAAPPTVNGLWEQSDDKGVVGAWFLFEEKDGLYFGRLVKMFKKPGEKLVEICTKCTGDQKNAKMLGLTIVKGMKRDALSYREGSILDPRDGSVYHAQMDLSEDGKQLSVRGYLGLPIFGQTQVWNRLPDDAIPADKMPQEVLASSPPPKP